MPEPMLVVIESPYRGHGYASLELNLRYARKCIRDSLLKGEYPIASHLLYTQEGILDDKKPEERKLGIEAGLVWGRHAQMSAVYIDLIDEWGSFVGIAGGVKRARNEGRPVEFRNLPDDVLNALDPRILEKRVAPDVLIRELELFLPSLNI